MKEKTFRPGTQGGWVTNQTRTERHKSAAGLTGSPELIQLRLELTLRWCHNNRQRTLQNLDLLNIRKEIVGLDRSQVLMNHSYGDANDRTLELSFVAVWLYNTVIDVKGWNWYGFVDSLF